MRAERKSWKDLKATLGGSAECKGWLNAGGNGKKANARQAVLLSSASPSQLVVLVVFPQLRCFSHF